MSRTKEKHVQVSMGICFWCGKENGQILLGKRLKTTEAPRYAISNYDACDTCEEGMASGITLIEVSEEPFTDKQRSLLKKQTCYPSGRFMVVKENALSHIFNEDVIPQIVKSRKCLVYTQMYQQLLPDNQGE